MLPIEIGDLTLTPKTGVLQQDLYNANIRGAPS